MFRLVGILIQKGCRENIRKNLQVGVPYFFVNDYCFTPQGLLQQNNIEQLPNDFFVDESVPFSLNISCIVGKNGDGKSSLIEIAFRIINNFSYVFGFTINQKSLSYINGLYATLYYEVDEVLCIIECAGNKVAFKSGRDIVSIHKSDKRTLLERKELLKNYEDKLFYTLVNNYSLYAYNSEEFKNEDGSKEGWLDALNKKNDAYQTPINFTPMRDAGCININREKKLTKQRLMVLFTDIANDYFEINNDSKAQGYGFDVEKDSKLVKKTLGAYFSSNLPNQILSIEKTTKSQNVVFISNIEKYVSQYSQIFTDAISITRSHRVECSDLDVYIEKLDDTLKKRILQIKIGDKGLKDCLKGVRFLQLQRIFLLIDVWEIWRDSGMLKIKDEKFESLLIKEELPRYRAILYIIYKTISIFETHPLLFTSSIENYAKPSVFLREKEGECYRKEILKKAFKALFLDIKNDKSHITLKLRQAIHFFNEYGKMRKYLIECGKNDDPRKWCGHKYYVDFKCLKKIISNNGKRDIITYLPPAFFEGDIILSKKNEVFFSISKLSSGERQLLNLTGGILYHLRNLSIPVKCNSAIKYSNINIVLDEIELYFHPEYQRQLIKYLIDKLQKCIFLSNKSVNIIIITHSPFVLSDIPKNNVLFIKNGIPDRTMQENTFGANIHTLLKDGFFLDQVPIGEFARQKISQLFEKLYNNQATPDMLCEIQLVSEPLLRSQLLKLYNQLLPFQLEQRVAELERRILELEGTAS